MITSAVVKALTIVNEILNSILVNLRLFSPCSTLCSLTLRIGRTRPTSFANRVRPENLAEMEFLTRFLSGTGQDQIRDSCGRILCGKKRRGEFSPVERSHCTTTYKVSKWLERSKLEYFYENHSTVAHLRLFFSYPSLLLRRMNFPRSTCTDIYIFPWQVDVLHVKKKMVAGLEDVWIIQDLVLREWFICRGLRDCRTAYFKWRKISQDRFSSMWSERLTPCPDRSAFDQHSGAISYERQDHNTLLFFLNTLRVFQRPFLACLFFFRLVPLLLLFFFRSKKGLFKIYFTSQAWWM